MFRAKKAQWYHMLDWGKMENTWKMLPNDVRNRIIFDGLYYHGTLNQAVASREGTDLGATNLSTPTQQVLK